VGASRPVLFLDGPLRGEVHEFAGWHFAAIEFAPNSHEFRQAAYRVTYHVKRASMFGREFHFAAIAPEPNGDDVLGLILTEAALAAMRPERVHQERAVW
jgi:hypothetical protein